MFVTRLLYEENPALLSCSAKVLDVIDHNNTAEVILDQTVFRSQDLPAQENEEDISDIGLIESDQKRFRVIRVERAEDTVRHIGTFEGDPFKVDEIVTCAVNEKFRMEVEENMID